MSTGLILLVDDERSIVSILTALLTQNGFTVTSAASGEEAVALARATAFDLLVTDVHLPRMSGLDLYAELAKIHPGIRVVFTSGGDPPTLPEGAVFLWKLDLMARLPGVATLLLAGPKRNP